MRKVTNNFGYAIIDGIEQACIPVILRMGHDQLVVLPFNLHDGNPCSEESIVTDIDGNKYNTVQIGIQCWMKENLRTTRYADSTPIVLDDVMYAPYAYRCIPNKDSSLIAENGYFYNWKAVMHSSDNNLCIPVRCLKD